MSKITLFHNPRCSKSRQALQLLEEKNQTPEVRLYLENPPSLDELKDLINKLNISPRELLRTSEQDYKDHNLADKSLSDEALLEAMVKFPKLIERPIAIIDDRAIIGRPPENVLDLLNG